MQTSFFPSSIKTGYSANSQEAVFTSADRQRLSLEESEYTKSYCVREILYEQYLWDMRCWHKPKYQYTKVEVMEHIEKWILDHKAGNWTNNCGHCLYCIRKLLANRVCTLEEIADYCLRNNFIKYSDSIGTWKNGIDESLDDIEQTSDC